MVAPAPGADKERAVRDDGPWSRTKVTCSSSPVAVA